MTKLNELSPRPGSTKNRMRVGRGPGSGKGKTAGRGQKGQTSRSGVSIFGFEGGQMPLHMRLPKRGFNNIFAKDYAEVNVGAIQKALDAGKLEAKGVIDHDALKAAGLARGGGRQRGRACLGLSDHDVVRAPVGHALECHQVTTRIDDADAANLF